MRGSDAGVGLNGVKIQKGLPTYLPCGALLSFPPHLSKYRFQQIDGRGIFSSDRCCHLLVDLTWYLEPWQSALLKKGQDSKETRVITGCLSLWLFVFAYIFPCRWPLWHYNTPQRFVPVRRLLTTPRAQNVRLWKLRAR